MKKELNAEIRRLSQKAKVNEKQEVQGEFFFNEGAYIKYVTE